MYVARPKTESQLFTSPFMGEAGRGPSLSVSAYRPSEIPGRFKDVAKVAYGRGATVSVINGHHIYKRSFQDLPRRAPVGPSASRRGTDIPNIPAALAVSRVRRVSMTGPRRRVQCNLTAF